MWKSRPLILPAFLLVLAGCDSRPEGAPVIGEAYAGPASLKVRRDFPLQSPATATVKFGDRLDIIGRRRKFIRVRTAGGAEGWVDERSLLSAAEMGRLRDLAEQAKSLPSQGAATTFDTLNVHTEPLRQSPSFLQVKEGEKVDVLAHQLSPRTAPTRAPLLPPTPKKPKADAKSRKPRKEPKYPPPPAPSAPRPPDNWLELSRTPEEDPDDASEKAVPEKASAKEEEVRPEPQDDWTLVRTAEGRSGWVLTRRLFMAIPDEVAQYAEGHRITSYFALGEVNDGDKVKKNWLWTTMAVGPRGYDFDSFRVFIWSIRRHRYETAYIERNLKGYFPVSVGPVEFSSQPRAAASSPSRSGSRRVHSRKAPAPPPKAAAATPYPGFSLCVEKSDGLRYRRSYAFMAPIVRYAGEQPCEAPRTILSGGSAPGLVTAIPPTSATPTVSFYARFKERVASLGKRWFSR